AIRGLRSLPGPRGHRWHETPTHIHSFRGCIRTLADNVAGSFLFPIAAPLPRVDLQSAAKTLVVAAPSTLLPCSPRIFGNRRQRKGVSASGAGDRGRCADQKR